MASQSTTIELTPALRCAVKSPSLAPKFTEDDHEWAARCEYWKRNSQTLNRNRAVRERTKQPLVLCGHGVSLRVHAGALLIRNGFTHYPQQQEIYRFFKGDLELPPRIIMMDGSGSISFDVLAWLAEQRVPLVRIDWQGNIQSVLCDSCYAANQHRVKWQLETRADPRRRMNFSIDLVTRKIEGCIKTLEKSIRRSPAWEKAMQRAYADLTRLECDTSLCFGRWTREVRRRTSGHGARCR